MKEKIKEEEPKSEWKNQIDIQELVPQSVYVAAHNPDKVEVKQVLPQERAYTLVVYEKDFQGLTEQKAWEAWQRDIKQLRQESPERLRSFLPDAPEGVDSFHEVYSSLIELNELTITDRILLLCCFVINPNNKEKLFVGDYNGVKGKGIATEFYTKNLPVVAKKLGVKFIIGINNKENISFFIDKIGRYRVSQLILEAKQKLFSEPKNLGIVGHNWTIQFLEPELIPAYVREEEIRKKLSN